MTRRAQRFLTRALTAALIVGAATFTPSPQDVFAQDDDWSVDGGDARTREIMRRYKVLLEKNPSEGLAFKKLVEMAGGGRGLDRLIKEYEGKAEKNPDKLNYRLILAHLLKQRARYEEALASYTRALEIDDKSAIAYLGRGECLMMLQKNVEATADYEKALAMSSDRAAKQDILRKLADLAFAQRDWEAAQGYYDRLVELDPRNEFLRMEYAQVLVKYRRYDKALEQYEELVKIAGRDVKARATTLRDMGDLYEKMGEDDKALATYRKAQGYVKSSNWLYRELEQRIIGVYRRTDRLQEYAEDKAKKWRSPNYDQAMILAALFDELGDEDKAYDYYKRASSRSSRAIDPRVKIIQILQRRGDNDGVIKAYLSLIRVAPSQARFQFDLAKIHFRNGDQKEAEKLLSRIRSRFRRDPDVLVQLADTYMRLGMRDDALDVYKQLVRADPRNEVYLTSLGEYYYQSGETQKAVETWEKLLDSNLPKPEAHAQLGLVLIEHNMVERGIRHYEKALELSPKDPEIRRGLAIAYELGRYWEKAVETWESLMVEGSPDSIVAEARGRIINIYRRDNTLRTKIREFKEAFEADPPDIDAGFFLAEAYSKLGESEKAERTWKQIIDADGKVDEKDIAALMELEKVYTQRSENKKAIAILQQLAELRPARSKDYYHRIAELSLKTYEEDQAIRYAKLALEKNPDDANAHARLADVYARMQRTDEAIAAYRVALDLDPRAFGVYFSLAELLLEKGQDEEASRLYQEIAKKAVDEAMVLLAARRAMALAQTTEQLEALEMELAPLVFKSPPMPVYRKVMLEIYGRLTAPLIARRNFGADLDELERNHLDSLAGRAFPILMDAVQSDDVGQRQLAVRMLGELRAPNAGLALARMVNDEREQLRLLAAVAVAQIGDERSAEPLLRALEDPNPAIHDAAAWALGSVGGDKSVKELTKILSGGSNSRLQAVAALSLGRIGNKRAVPALLSSLEESRLQRYNDSLAVSVSYALGALGDSRAVEPLADVLQKSNGAAGDAAAWALGHIGNKRAVEVLFDTYWSGDRAQRNRARRGLVWLSAGKEKLSGDDLYRRMLAESRFVDDRDLRFNSDDLIEALVADVTFTPMVDPSAMVSSNIDTIAKVARDKLASGSTEVKALTLEDLTRPELLLGLGVSKSPESVEAALRGVLKTLHSELLAAARSESNEDPRIVRASLVLLGLLGDANDLELLLQKAADEDPTIRREAIHGLSLGFTTKDRAHAVMVKGLADQDFSVRAACASALGGIGKGSASKSVTDALVARLADDYISVRVEAAKSLGRLEATAAIPKLIAALGDDSRDVQRAAIASLARMDDPKARAEVEKFKNHSDWRLREAAMGKMN